MEIFILAILILINALFAMSEIAVVSSRKIRLQQMAEAGFGGAQSALTLIQDPSRFLSTVQFGITLIGILSGAYGEAALASRLQSTFTDVPLLARYAHEIALGVVVVAARKRTTGAAARDSQVIGRANNAAMVSG